MEVLNGVVPKSLPCNYSSTTSRNPSSLSFSQVCFPGKSRFEMTKVGDCGFEDKGHLEYYYHQKVSPFCGEGKGKKGWNGVSTKKKMKLLKGLAKDLSTFSDLGFGLDLFCDVDTQGFVADDKSKIISQAADVLLAQLKQLRAEEDQLKKKEKEEKGKCKTGDCESSSSSSSESSDSECDEIVDLKCVRDKAIEQPIETPEMHLSNVELSSATPSFKESSTQQISTTSDQECCKMILEVTLDKYAGIAALNSGSSNLNQSNVSSIGSSVGVKSEGKRIEVCMGGKCKKSGAPALMEEFQRAIGDEGAVVGCKCMGKCKSGPNVKVSNSSIGGSMGDDSLRSPSNPLYIGVGLQDVGLIVANHFGEEMTGMGLSAAGVTS